MLVRIYYFKGQMTRQNVNMLGGNVSWTELNSQEFNVKVRNLTNMGYTIFHSWDDPNWNIDDVIRRHAGSTFGAGLIELN
jgi:hypothetical protein